MTHNVCEETLLKINSLDLFQIISHAFASKERVNTLKYLYDNPGVKHMELTNNNPAKNRASNYFSYHLMLLKKSQLISHDKRRDLYYLSDLGYDCMDFIKRIEQRQQGIKAINDEGIFKDIDNPKKYIAFLKNTIRFYEMNFSEEK